MKRLIFILVALFCIIGTYAQNMKEVVYLKNGSVIKGIIIEQIPNKSMKIQTADGSIFAFDMSEVTKITKEVAVNDKKSYYNDDDENDDDNELSRFHLSVRGGSYLSAPTYFYDSLLDLTGGLGMDFRLGPSNVYLETGLYYENKGYEYNNVGALVIPLLVSYHIPVLSNKKMTIQPFAGTYGSYEFDTENQDYGIRIGCGWNFTRLYVNFGYDIGLCEFTNYYSDFKKNGFFATIGYNIAGSK